jgi:acyl-CoA synthetase (NDP forming)
MLNPLKSRICSSFANCLVSTQFRGIKLHEYQAGALLSKYRVPVPIGKVAFDEDEAYKIAKKFKGGCVIKS